MSDQRGKPLSSERIDVNWDYALCAWARHFNASEQRIKEAVKAVGDRADRVREHLAANRGAASSGGSSERPSSH